MSREPLDLEPPKPTYPTSREEWKSDISHCAVAAAKYLGSDKTKGFEETSPELASYRGQRDTILDAIMSAISEVETLRTELAGARQEIARLTTQAAGEKRSQERTWVLYQDKNAPDSGWKVYGPKPKHWHERIEVSEIAQPPEPGRDKKEGE